jgi:hypothetical protein
VAAAVVETFSEGRGFTVASNIPEIVHRCRRLATHLGASLEIIERDDG